MQHLHFLILNSLMSQTSRTQNLSMTVLLPNQTRYYDLHYFAALTYYVDMIRMPLSTEIRISTHFDTFSIDYRFYSIGHMSFVSRTHPPSFSAHLIRNITSLTHSRRTIFELSSLSTILPSKPSKTFENLFYPLRSSLSSLFHIRIS